MTKPTQPRERSVWRAKNTLIYTSVARLRMYGCCNLIGRSNTAKDIDQTFARLRMYGCCNLIGRSNTAKDIDQTFAACFTVNLLARLC